MSKRARPPRSTAASDIALATIVDSLRSEVAQLQQRVRELEAELRVPPSLSPAPSATALERDPHTPASKAAPPRSLTNRRNLLLKGAAVAAASVTAAVAADTAAASPAGADDGDNLVLGSNNTVDSTTAIIANSVGPPTQGMPMLMVKMGDAAYQGYDSGVITGTAWYDGNSGSDFPTVPVYGVVGMSNAPNGGGGYFTDGNGRYDGTGSPAVTLASSYAQIFFAAGADALPRPPLLSFFPRQPGELVFDENTDLWLCIAGGTPGTWRKISGGGTAGALVALDAPGRIYDSRADLPPLAVTKARLQDGEERGVSALVGQFVPSAANAVMCNVTVTNTSEHGWVAVYAGNTTWGGTSTINWFQPGSTIANAALVKLDSSGFMTVKCGGGGSTDIAIDVVGYYQ